VHGPRPSASWKPLLWMVSSLAIHRSRVVILDEAAYTLTRT